MALKVKAVDKNIKFKKDDPGVWCYVLQPELYTMFLLADTHTGSSFITGLFTAITPERLWGTYGSSR